MSRPFRKAREKDAQAANTELSPGRKFFVLLVLWFHEGFVLIPVGLGLYLYMLAEFFVFQNPAVRSRKGQAPPAK